MTPTLSLVLYNTTTDATASFLTWRTAIDGTAVSSNFYLIDTAVTADRARLTALEALKFVNIVHATFVSGSTYIASPSTIASYVDQTIIALDIDTTNLGTVQIDLNSLGLRSLVKKDSTGASVNLTAGDLVKNRIYFFKYDLASTSWFWMAGTSGDQLNVPGTTGNIATITSSGGLDGSTTQSLMISQTVHAATGKTTFAASGLDSIPLVDTEDSNKLKQMTSANLKTQLASTWGAQIAALTPKTVAATGDRVVISDVTGDATKQMTLGNLMGVINALASKSTPIAADLISIYDTISSSAKNLSFTNLLAYLQTNLANVTSTAHGFAPIAPADATKFLNGAATPAYALVKDSDLSTSNITTNNATSSKHGFLPILSNSIVDVFRGDGSYGPIYAPEGFLQNGKITVTVSSNNLTVAIKGIDGNDPSVTNPVYVRINNVIRSITSALSVTAAAGTSWCNSGAAETATQAVDYFCYLGYNTGTSAVVIGFSRIPWAKQYNDFSATSTNDRYCKISDITTIASTDYFTVIGRFEAILSATASFNWSVNTFTALNLINTPIYTTRVLTYTPTWTNVTTTSATISASYYINNIMMDVWASITFGASTAFTGTVSTSIPMASTSLQVSTFCGQSIFRDVGVTQYAGNTLLNSTTTINPQALNASATYLTNSAVNATVPHTWNSTDILATNARVNLN